MVLLEEQEHKNKNKSISFFCALEFLKKYNYCSLLCCGARLLRVFICHIQILHAEEYHRPDYNEMVSLVYGLISKYQVDKVYIDGANPSFMKSLKLQADKFDKLITALRTAVDNDGILDKESTSYNDVFDAFRLALKFYSFRDSSEYD